VVPRYVDRINVRQKQLRLARFFLSLPCVHAPAQKTAVNSKQKTALTAVKRLGQPEEGSP